MFDIKFIGEVSTTCDENKEKKHLSGSLLSSSSINDEVEGSYGRPCIKSDITYITGNQLRQSEVNPEQDDISNVSNESTALMVFPNSNIGPRRYKIHKYKKTTVHHSFL